MNLFKSILLFKNGYIGIDGACRFKGAIWFINLHKAMELFMNYAAKQCGEFCYSTYWIHGLISNWRTLANTFRKLLKIEAKAYKGKFKKLEIKSTPFSFTRFTWPRAALITSVWASPFATKECLYAKVCCLGIIDTNISGHIVNNPIPGNDDSLDSIIFYNTHISQYILERKYGFVISWFNRVKASKRVHAFASWVLQGYVTTEGKFNKEKVHEKQDKLYNPATITKKLVNNKTKLSTIWGSGFKFFFAKNLNLSAIKEQVDVYDFTTELSLTIFDLILLQKRNAIFYTKIFHYTYMKSRLSRLTRLRAKFRFNTKSVQYKMLTGFYLWGKNLKNKDYKMQKPWKTNLWFNKFKRNKIFRTFFKKKKFFKTKGYATFLKYFILNEFAKYYGGNFFSRFQINLLNTSHLSFVMTLYYPKFLKFKMYNSIGQNDISFWKNAKFFRSGISPVALYWKKNIKEKIATIIHSHDYSNIIKLKFYYTSLKKIKSYVQKVTSNLFYAYFCYFMSKYWSIKNYKKVKKYQSRLRLKKYNLTILKQLKWSNVNRIFLKDAIQKIWNTSQNFQFSGINVEFKYLEVFKYFKFLLLKHMNNYKHLNNRLGLIRKYWLRPRKLKYKCKLTISKRKKKVYKRAIKYQGILFYINFDKLYKYKAETIEVEDTLKIKQKLIKSHYFYLRRKEKRLRKKIFYQMKRLQKRKKKTRGQKYWLSILKYMYKYRNYKFFRKSYRKFTYKRNTMAKKFMTTVINKKYRRNRLYIKMRWMLYRKFKKIYSRMKKVLKKNYGKREAIKKSREVARFWVFLQFKDAFKVTKQLFFCRLLSLFKSINKKDMNSLIKLTNNELTLNSKLKNNLRRLFKNYKSYCKFKYYKKFIFDDKLIKIKTKKNTWKWLRQSTNLLTTLKQYNNLHENIYTWQYQVKNINNLGWNFEFNQKYEQDLFKVYFNKVGEKTSKEFECEKDTKAWFQKFLEVMPFTKDELEYATPYDYTQIKSLYGNMSKKFVNMKPDSIDLKLESESTGLNVTGLEKKHIEEFIQNSSILQEYSTIENVDEYINKEFKIFNKFAWIFRVKDLRSKHIRSLYWTILRQDIKKQELIPLKNESITTVD